MGGLQVLASVPSLAVLAAMSPWGPFESQGQFWLPRAAAVCPSLRPLSLAVPTREREL